MTNDQIDALLHILDDGVDALTKIANELSQMNLILDNKKDLTD